MPYVAPPVHLLCGLRAGGILEHVVPVHAHGHAFGYFNLEDVGGKVYPLYGAVKPAAGHHLRPFGERVLEFLYFLLKSSPLASVIATMQKSTGTNNKTFFISDDFN